MATSTPEAPAVDERTAILDGLKAITPSWVELKLRHERSEGLDSQLNREYNRYSQQINFLLDQLGVTDGIPS